MTSRKFVLAAALLFACTACTSGAPLASDRPVGSDGGATPAPTSRVTPAATKSAPAPSATATTTDPAAPSATPAASDSTGSLTASPRPVSGDVLVEASQACCLRVSEDAIWVRTLYTFDRIDPETESITASVQIPVDMSTMDAGFGSVWANNPLTNEVLRLDIDSGETLATMPVGELPDFLLVGAEAVWASNLMAGTVSRIDPETDEVVATIAIGQQGVARAGPMVEVDATLWVNDIAGNAVFGIDTETNEVVTSVELEHSPCGITSAAERIWVGACSESGAGLTAIDPDVGTVVGRVELPAYFHPEPGIESGGLVWFPYGATDTPGLPMQLLGIDPETPVVVDSVLLHQGVSSVAVGFDSIWATGPKGVYRLPSTALDN